jgi:pimeloyl-[acyl-carrier protein] methyl ester esterase
MIENTIFFHGWGYDYRFWQSYRQNYNTHTLFYNRGYFGDYAKPKLGKGKNRCVTHSMGLFFALQEYDLSDFDEIVIYAGFKVFPNQIATKAMRLGLKKNPEKILHDFYKICGYTPTTYMGIDWKKLGDDLKMLETSDISQDLQDITYTAYHGQFDMILPNPLEGAIILENTGHLCNLIKM